uniref:EGF-like domain-containing protein n=1 Tax=Steinernema glaseri TaxID=37863 RepID=A0A1I7Z423_9BILA
MAELATCPIPCLNGGVCIGFKQQVTCWCPSTFYGVSCQFMHDDSANHLIWLISYVAILALIVWGLFGAFKLVGLILLAYHRIRVILTQNQEDNEPTDLEMGIPTIRRPLEHDGLEENMSEVSL